MSILYSSFTAEQMVDVSDLIVKGHVKNISASRWNTTDGKTPMTENLLEYSLFHDIIIEVDEFYKGEATGDTKEIVVRQPGGVYGNIRQTVSVPQYYEGEEVILYLIEDFSLAFDNDKMIYSQINQEGQIFVISDNVGINGLGEMVEIQSDIISNVDKFLNK